MNNNMRKILIGLGVGLLATGGIAIAANNSRKKKLYKKIDDAIDGNKNVTGTAKDVASNEAFNPFFWKTIAPPRTIYTVAGADERAKKIYDAIGYIYDSETAIVSVIKDIPTKAKLSFVSDRFLTVYGEYLGTFIATHVDKGDNLDVIKGLVESMPVK